MQPFFSGYQTEKTLIHHKYADLTKLVKHLLKLFVQVTGVENCESGVASRNIRYSK